MRDGTQAGVWAALPELRSHGPPRRVRAAPVWLARAVREPFARVNERPVIVLGNQKSGTSAVAGLVASATRSSVALDLRNEQTASPAFIACRLGRLPFSELVRRNRLDFSRDIVKEPNLSVLFRQVRAAFPDAPVILVVRNPYDNIRSLLNWMRIPGDSPDVPPEAADRLTTVQRSVLHAGWLGIRASSYIESLACRWNLIADVHLGDPDRVGLVRYEDFCADKVATVGRIARALDLDVQHDVSGEVDRQFQPRGDRSVRRESFFGANLGRITAVCADRMRRLGYRPEDPRPSPG
jgi:hypothetical protein